MTQSIIKILKKNIKITNIIDDDPIWVGKRLMKIKVKKYQITIILIIIKI